MDHFHTLRGHMQKQVTDRVVSGIRSEDARACIALMITGVRQESWSQVAKPFRRIGAAHLLAISGLHLALLAGGCVLLFQCWVGESAWRGRFVLLVILLYLLVVQWRPPILRAGCMLGMYSLGLSFRRRVSSWGMISAAFLALLIVQPGQLFMPGFQLSFLVVSALIFGTRRVNLRWIGGDQQFSPGWCRRMMRTFASAWNVSLIAWLISTPVVMYHFEMCSPYGVLASVVLLFPTALILYLSYMRLLVGWACPPLDDVLRYLLEWICGIVIATVNCIDRIPGSSFETESPQLWLVVLSIVAVTCWMQFGVRNTIWACRQHLVRLKSFKTTHATSRHDPSDTSE